MCIRDSTKILIDIGPDFRNQFLENKLEDVDAVLLTHEHNDHVIGMDDIRAINFIQKKSIPIYAKQTVIAQLNQRFSYAFGNNKYPGTPLIHLVPIGDSPFFIDEVEIIPVHLLHGRLDILGFRVGDFAYLTDASSIPESEYTKLNQLKILIINALRKEPHHSHFTLTEALDEIERINPERAFLTHISHKMGPSSVWGQELPDTVSALNDKMILETH